MEGFTFIFMLSGNAVFLVKTTVDTLTHETLASFLQVLMPVVLYAFLLYSVIIMTVMAIRSSILAKKTTIAYMKHGLSSLSISFVMFIGGMLLFLASELLTFEVWLETIALILALVGLFYIYRGFVKPADEKET